MIYTFFVPSFCFNYHFAFFLPLLHNTMANKRDRRRDTIVEYYDHENEAVQSKLDRVVMVSIDENSAEYVYNWTLDNIVQPERDLVVLTHVRILELPMAPYVDSTGYLEEEAEERRQESHELLKAYASRLWHKRIACKAISMIGEPKNEIVRKATEIKADMLIMGSRNMGTIKRTILGSVSTYCVHNAPCSVIIAKPPMELHPDDATSKQNRRRSILSRITSFNS
ncbi:hypothetical protein BCR43DRAFT_487628 [Syncephalastrum racemosum]|uniref:UspA domain-containing protein n=1 Tax=Syncephalastrum racemosum TaxID=13706 RepID=A0A1X2HHA2_SYNRA|nr:hypothetical protein BCR43DRAFT_487628 [Syncephalastrum racemosum]